MKADVRRFTGRLALFAVPVLVYLAGVVVIDPYIYFDASGAVSDSLKAEISYPINYAMWKILAFRRDPQPNLILGDSRSMALDAEYVSEVAGERFANLGYGGGSLREAIDTFWLAVEETEVRSVTVGLNLHNYSASNRKDRVREVRAALRNPLVYCVNFNVLRAAGRLIGAVMTGESTRIGTPAMTEAEFWRYQLDVVARVYFGGYRYPDEYRRDLGEMADYCREHGITLNFVLMPNHVEMQRKIAEFDLEAEAARMREDLRELGTVYDFAYANPMTADRRNYVDPYHFDAEFMRLIVRSVWGPERDYVRILAPPAGADPDSPS